MTVTEPTHDTVEDQPVITDHEAAEESAELVEEDVLVEEISIDGMCGVY